MSIGKRNNFTVTPPIGSIGSVRVNGFSISEINGQTIAMNSKVTTWSNNIATRNAASRPNLKSTWIANNLANAIDAASYGSKIKYLLPFIGPDNIAALEPLIDTLAVGYADNVGGAAFTFSEATGMQGDGATKVMDTRITPSQLGTSNNGGIGYWENNIAFDGTTTNISAAFSTDNTNVFGLAVHSTFPALFWWGLQANSATSGSSSATNGHFYGQRSSATSREVFKNGSSLATNTTSDATSGASDRTIAIIGRHLGGGTYSYFHGRCACYYLTDGTMSSGDITALDTLLRDYLFTPTGRPAS
jgi:hypothetical protein